MARNVNPLLSAYIVALGLVVHIATADSFWVGYNASDGVAWRWQGPQTDATYWLSQTQETIAAMQATYWNGSYWPTTIQWIGAVLDTLLAATDETFAATLPSRNASLSSLVTSDILTYYTQNSAYYESEDTDQIFDAAYDDVQWVVLEWLRTIESVRQIDSATSSNLGMSNITAYAHRAHIFYNVVANKYDTSLCDGGLTWNPALQVYKNAITNELFVATSVEMYLYFPGDNNTDPYPSPGYADVTNRTLPPLTPLQAHDKSLLAAAEQEYAWFRSHNFTNEQGLIVDGFHISAGQTSCDQRNEMVYTYNQGVILSGLRGLWESTGNETYLADGYAYIATVINATGWNAADADSAAVWAGLGRNGIMEDYCDAAGTCSQDDLIFKGVYFQHLDQFCTPLPTAVPLVPGVSVVAPATLAAAHAQQCSVYADWIEHNAHAALTTRSASGVIGEWWGASYLNQTEASETDYKVGPPAGSVQITRRKVTAQSSLMIADARGKRRYITEKRDDSPQVYTVETQGQGLSVVKAATNAAMRRATIPGNNESRDP